MHMDYIRKEISTLHCTVGLALTTAPRWSATGSSPRQNNYLYDAQTIVSSLVDTLCPLIAVTDSGLGP